MMSGGLCICVLHLEECFCFCWFLLRMARAFTTLVWSVQVYYDDVSNVKDIISSHKVF